MDMEGMYGGSFQDPDGHVWELMWMHSTVADTSDLQRSAAR